jgi:hypothetical protein
VVATNVRGIAFQASIPGSSAYAEPPEAAIEKRMRARIWLGILIGSSVGGLIPELWGAGVFSYSSVLFSGIGAFVGLLISYQ